MIPKNRHRAARAVLTLGVAAGVWSLAVATRGAEAVSPARPAAAAVVLHGVQLAQAGAPAPTVPDLAAMVAAGDVAAGQAAAAACAGCHSLGEGEAARFGPNLYGVVGRPVASAAGFAYSPAMGAAGAAGGAWTIELLDAFLMSPQTAIPGTTMPFAGIADAATRVNVIAYLATLAGAAAPAAPAGIPVTFTAAQADRGLARYTRYCVECHGDTLTGGLIGGPPLRGLAFEAKYLNGAPASVLFGFTSSVMPPDDPGRLGAAVYADLVAYILQQNGFTPGAADLPTNLEALGAMIMVKPGG